MGAAGRVPRARPAVAGAALLIRKYWDPMAAYLGGVWEGIKDGLGPALTTIGEALAPLAPVFGVFADAVGAVVGWIGSLLDCSSSQAPITTSFHGKGSSGANNCLARTLWLKASARSGTRAWRISNAHWAL